MKKNKLIIIILGMFAVSNLVAVLEDSVVESVLPRDIMQKRANPGGKCSVYPDGKYYLYEGEACILWPISGNAEFNSATASYDSTILSVFACEPFQYESTGVGPYVFSPARYQAIIVAGLNAGQNNLKVSTVYPNGTYNYMFEVISYDSTQLTVLDNSSLFTAIAKSDLATISNLIQKGVSLSQVNSNNQTAMQAVASTGNQSFIIAVAKLIQDPHILYDLMTSLVAQSSTTDLKYTISTIMQYMPSTSLKVLDTTGTLQAYCHENGVSGALLKEDFVLAQTLLEQGYIPDMTLDSTGSNPLLLGITKGQTAFVQQCVAVVPVGQLNQVGTDGLTPLMLILQIWNNDSKRSVYQPMVESLITKLNQAQISYKNAQGKTALDYAHLSQDPLVTIMLETYFKESISLTPQEIVDQLSRISPSSTWTPDLMHDGYQFLTTVKNVNEKDSAGNTALMLAIQQNKSTIAGMLATVFSFPALVTVNKQNQSALQIAQTANMQSVVKQIQTRISFDNNNYFYDGVSDISAGCFYIPSFFPQEGVFGFSDQTLSSGTKIEASEVRVRGGQYIYLNAAGKISNSLTPAPGVFYVARPMGESLGGTKYSTIMLEAFKSKLPYSVITAAVRVYKNVFDKLDTQYGIKKYIEEVGFFAALEQGDLAIITKLIKLGFKPKGYNKYKQNAAMAALVQAINRSSNSGFSSSDFMYKPASTPADYQALVNAVWATQPDQVDYLLSTINFSSQDCLGIIGALKRDWWYDISSIQNMGPDQFRHYITKGWLYDGVLNSPAHMRMLASLNRYIDSSQGQVNLQTNQEFQKENLVWQKASVQFEEIAIKLMKFISLKDHGHQDDQGRTLLMYIIQAGSGMKSVAAELISVMKPEDLVKADKRGITAYGLLKKHPNWKSLIDELVKKVDKISLYYTDTLPSQFTYIPNEQGTGGTVTVLGKKVILSEPDKGFYMGTNNLITTCTKGDSKWNEYIKLAGGKNTFTSYSLLKPHP